MALPLELFPDNWMQTTADDGVLLKLAGFSCAGNLLWVLLIHLIDGISLRQTTVVARKLGFKELQP